MFHEFDVCLFALVVKSLVAAGDNSARFCLGDSRMLGGVLAYMLSNPFGLHNAKILQDLSIIGFELFQCNIHVITYPFREGIGQEEKQARYV